MGEAGPSCTAPPIRRATRAISCSPPRAEQLDFLRFPLGGLPKAETRALAAALRPAGRRQARQPGHLLRARRATTPRVVEQLRPEARRARRHRRPRRPRARPPRRRHPLHRRPAPRPGLGERAARQRAALRRAARARGAPRRRRPARGARPQRIALYEVNWLGAATSTARCRCRCRVRSTQPAAARRGRARRATRVAGALRRARERRRPRPGLRALRPATGSRVLGGGFIRPLRAMMKLDHLNLPVSNLERSRDWWVSTLGLKVEFEVPDTRTVALNDGEGFAIFLQEKPNVSPTASHYGSRSKMSTPRTPPGPRAVCASIMGRRRTFGATVPSSPIPTAISSACGTRSR